MAVQQQESIANLLVKNIPRELVIAVEEAAYVGAERAFAAAKGMDDGHLPSVVGHMRHFHINETFRAALASNNCSPSPLRGSTIVTGQAGILTVARFNSKDREWANARRSQIRRRMAEDNRVIEMLVQRDLFHTYAPPTEGVAFFVACFAESLNIQPESPVSLHIAVPDPQMRKWLFRESLDDFIQRYDVASNTQEDGVTPKLKADIGKQIDINGTKS